MGLLLRSEVLAPLSVTVPLPCLTSAPVPEMVRGIREAWGPACFVQAAAIAHRGDASDHPAP